MTNHSNLIDEYEQCCYQGIVENARVMMVDDEPINIKVVQKFLQSAGHQHFLDTTDSTKAVEIIRSELPDVVLLDIMMPQVNGLEILRMIRSDRALLHIPVIILTAYCDPQTKREALESGATDFLAKPVDPSELIPRVRNALVVKAHHDHLTKYAERLEGEVMQCSKQLVASREEAELRYLAGKAEIATDVLHNVGNALHSLNISTNVLHEIHQNSKLPFLQKVAQLTNDHAENLPEFFTDDERGRVIPAYLLELADVLRQEREQIIQEVDSLSKHLTHVNAVVETQQKYANVHGVEELVSLEVLLADAEELSGITQNTCAIEVNRHYAELPDIFIDKQKLLQILVNVIKNAQESALQMHPGGGGRIDISLQQSDQHLVQISIADNGVGISPEFHVRIFSHGFTTKPAGHGFGLHSCANFAKDLGGSMSVHSDGEGRGATFVLTLPLSQDDDRQIQDSKQQNRHDRQSAVGCEN